jgi:hypothetical protein
MVIPSGPSEVDADVFYGTLCLLPALVFGGGRISASNPPAPVSRFPPLYGGDAPVVLPILLATTVAAAVVVEVAAAAAEATSIMIMSFSDTRCAS